MAAGGQGYAPGSSWSRRQAWVLYGFTLSGINTGDRKYIDVARKCAKYFIANIREDGPQRVELGAHRTRTLTLDRLIKCDNPSAFPALRQIEVYGR